MTEGIYPIFGDDGVDALGRQIDVVTLARPAWQSALVDAGIPDPMAAELTQMYGADQDRLLQPTSSLSYPCYTELRTTIGQIVPASQT